MIRLTHFLKIIIVNNMKNKSTAFDFIYTTTGILSENTH